MKTKIELKRFVPKISKEFKQRQYKSIVILEIFFSPTQHKQHESLAEYIGEKSTEVKYL